MTSGPKQPIVRRWKRGEQILARRGNETIDAVNTLLRGANGARGASPISARAGATLQRFRVVNMNTADVVTCHTWDGTTEGVQLINIALPYLLRRTPFDGQTRDGVSYTYTSNVERSASDGVDNETQVIVPGYVDNDEIWATGTNVIIGGVGVAGVVWLDLNLDGRAWAAT